MICYHNSKPKLKGFMRHIKMFWQEKYPTANMDMKQLDNQRYSIIKKQLLSDLELKELSRLPELNDTVQEELEDMSGSPAETPNVLVDEPPLSAENLPTNIQTLRQNIMHHLPAEQGQWPYLPNLRYKITDEILAQTKLALKTIPTWISLKPMHWSMPQLGHYREVWGEKGSWHQTPPPPQCLSATAGEQKQGIEIWCQQTSWDS